MGMSAVDAEAATVADVVAYAATLRERAAKLTTEGLDSYDPYARPYAPSDDAARKLVTRTRAKLLGALPADAPEWEREAEAARAPQVAKDELRWRAARADGRYREDIKATDHRDKRLGKIREKAAQTREARRRGLTPGQRIDNALLGLACLATGPAASLEAKVSSGEGDHGVAPFPGDPHSDAEYIAREAARKIEARLDAAHGLAPAEVKAA